MKRKSTKVLFTITMLLAAICFPKFSYAQIVYNNKGLNIGGAPEHPYLGVTVNNYLGMYWTCKGYNFFQLDISPANPRIAGTGDEVVFLILPRVLSIVFRLRMYITILTRVQKRISRI